MHVLLYDDEDDDDDKGKRANTHTKSSWSFSSCVCIYMFVYMLQKFAAWQFDCHRLWYGHTILAELRAHFVPTFSFFFLLLKARRIESHDCPRWQIFFWVSFLLLLLLLLLLILVMMMMTPFLVDGIHPKRAVKKTRRKRAVPLGPPIIGPNDCGPRRVVEKWCPYLFHSGWFVPHAADLYILILFTHVIDLSFFSFSESRQ